MTKYYLTIDEEELTTLGTFQLPSYVDSVLSAKIGGYSIPFSFNCKSKGIGFLHNNGTILIEYYSVAKDREMKLNQLLKEL